MINAADLVVDMVMADPVAERVAADPALAAVNADIRETKSRRIVLRDFLSDQNGPRRSPI